MRGYVLLMRHGEMNQQDRFAQDGECYPAPAKRTPRPWPGG